LSVSSRQIGDVVRLLQTTELSNTEISNQTGVPYSRVAYLATVYRTKEQRTKIAQQARLQRRKENRFLRDPYEVYHLRYHKQMTYSQIAAYYGVSLKRAREIVKRAEQWISEQDSKMKER
jgi:hypothetical protein